MRGGLDRFLAAAAVALVLTGCAAGVITGPPGAALSTYLAEEGSHRIVQLNDSGVEVATLTSFISPRGISVDANGIYVANTGYSQIVQVMDMTGAGLTTYGGFGSGVGQFSGPSGLFVHPSGIYVADTDNHRIVQITNITGLGWATLGDPLIPGSGLGQFNRPNGIFVDSLGRIYVADTGNHRIVQMKNITGTGWTTLGSMGQGLGQFSSPRGIFTDNSGHIYVADTDNNRVVQMNDMSGTGWTAFTGVGSAVGSLGQPKGISVDTTGHIFITDGNNGRLVRIDDISGTRAIAFSLGVGTQPWGVYLR